MREIKFRAWDKLTKDMIYDIAVGNGKLYEVVEDDDIAPELVDRLIPMQYTGLKDKNGVEIYEGDVIRFDDEYNQEIKWDNHYSGFTPWVQNQEGYDTFEDYPGVVIGNIYENKELI